MRPTREPLALAEPSLDNLFWTHLADLHASEKQLVLSLERLCRAADGSELQDMLAGYRKEAEEQVERLERILDRGDAEARNESASSDVLDAGLIVGVRFLAEYKIAAYRAAQRWAALLGYEDLIDTFQVSLDEEARVCLELIALGEAVTS